MIMRKNIRHALFAALLCGAHSFPLVPVHKSVGFQAMTGTTNRGLAETLLKSSSSGSLDNRPQGKGDLLFDGKSRQLLGLKDADAATEKWKLRLQLTKPLTWIPLSLVVMCGAAASGNYHWMWNPFDVNDRDLLLGLEDALKGLATVLLAGPFSEGFAQTINDWYDREIDAINEPYRPIPSGAISMSEVMEQLRFLFLGGLLTSLTMDIVLMHHAFPVITAITLLGYVMSYIYSAPPLKLKQNGWLGDLAIGLCYVSLPWWCGHAVFGSLDHPVDWILPLVYSLVGLSAGIVNDFKSIEGDKKFGMKSLPILLGVDGAKWLAAVLPDVVQLGIAAYFNSIGEPAAALVLLGLLLPQMYFQSTLLIKDPFENDVKFMAFSQPFVMLGVMVSAYTLGQHVW